MQNANPSTVKLKSHQGNTTGQAGMIGWGILNEPLFIKIAHAFMIGSKGADSRIKHQLSA